MRDWLVVSNQTPAGWVNLREQALWFNFSARFDRDEFTLYCSTPSAYFIEESVCILMMLQRRQGRDRIPSDEESARDRQPGPWGSSIPWGPHIPSSRFVLSFIKYMIKLYGKIYDKIIWLMVIPKSAKAVSSLQKGNNRKNFTLSRILSMKVEQQRKVINLFLIPFPKSSSHMLDLTAISLSLYDPRINKSQKDFLSSFFYQRTTMKEPVIY